MRVFISSVQDGYEGYREAAAEAIRALGHEPVRVDRRYSPNRSPLVDCIKNVDECEVVVLLLGRRYGTVIPETGDSVVRAEWDHARVTGRAILAFREQFNGGEEDEPQQAEFVNEVGDLENGRRWTPYANEAELVLQIVGALNDIAEEPDRLVRLPRDCQEYLGLLREKSKGLSARVVGLLSAPDARTSGFLAGVVGDPPEWLPNTVPEVWEAIGSFQHAHDLLGADLAWKLAIEAGSPRAEIILARQALIALGDDNLVASRGFLAEMSADHPLFAVTEACLDNDPVGVVEAIVGDRLHESDDTHLALFCVLRLMWAYWEQGHSDAAVEASRQANRRFPNRAWLLHHQAMLMLGVVDQMDLGSQDSRAILSEASDLALRARDLFREWDGPSNLGAALAMRAFWAMQEPASALAIAHPPPDGEATPSEAVSPDVQSELDRALLALGRVDEINTHPLSDESPFEQALLAAMQAHVLGDSTALPMARYALSLAHDEPETKQALHGLALCGETDMDAMAGLPAADQALLRGVAALHGTQPDPQLGIEILSEHQTFSPYHVNALADALLQAEDVDGAVAVLRRGASRFDNMALFARAADLLASDDSDDTQLGEAISVAETVLARNSPSDIRHGMRRLLVDVARRREDWRTMESYALAMASEFPEGGTAKWEVVSAIYLQGDCQRAWTQIAAHDLIPHTPQHAQLVAAIAQGVDKSDHDVQRLLGLVGPFRDHEEVAGMVMAALLIVGEDAQFSEATLAQMREFGDDSTIRHPNSNLVRRLDFDSPEAAIEAIVNLARPRPDEVNYLVTGVRNGIAPYGLLQLVGQLPHALTLLDASAGFLTAVSFDAAQRQAEKSAAIDALNGTVVVDISAVAACLRSGIDIGQLAQEFALLFVGDAQISDARRAVVAARTPVVGTLGYDALLDRPVLETVSETERAEKIEMAERAAAQLDTWEAVPAGTLPPLDPILEEIGGSWESATRVAQSKQCALWSDDLPLRIIATAAGIPAFGTWALCEAIAEQSGNSHSLDMTQLGIEMLRARLADIPLTLNDLEHSAIEHDDPCFSHLLARPATWRPPHNDDTISWYQARVSALVESQHSLKIPRMLRASAFGLGAACLPPDMVNAIGGLLAATIWRVKVISEVAAPPEMAFWLTAAARKAVFDLDPSADTDPLRNAVQCLCNMQAGYTTHEDVARLTLLLFAELESLVPDDWQIVVETTQAWLLQAEERESE